MFTPRAKANCKINLQEWTLRKLSETVAGLREAGVTDSEIRNAFAVSSAATVGKVRCCHDPKPMRSLRLSRSRYW
jgi:hypothetical protein